MHQFTVMTCNVGNGRAKPDHLARVLHESHADLIGIQELSTDQSQAISQELAVKYPYQSLFPGGFAGKALISQYPIIDHEQLHLSRVRPDLKATIDIDGCRVTFLIAHPPPPHPHWSGVRFDADTWNQINRLAQLAMEDPPSVLLGDFNLTDWRGEYKYLRKLGLKDAFREAGMKRGHTLPRRIGPWKRYLWVNRLLSGVPLIPVLRVDYIWFTPPIQCQQAWVGQDTGSDHLPVVARLKI